MSDIYTAQTQTQPELRRHLGRERMETTCHIEDLATLTQNLERRVLGQEEAIESLLCALSRIPSGLRDTSRPLLTALLLGPTGVGKTETAKALAEGLFGSDVALTRIDCEEYSHGHEVSKLLGSPPGYVGFHIEPMLSQGRIDRHHRHLVEDADPEVPKKRVLADSLLPTAEHEYVSVVLFDEIEKAHPTLWNALLGILEEGVLSLGDNSTTDLTRSVVLMTSNVGSRELAAHFETPLGFQQDSGEVRASAVSLREAALRAAKNQFPLEFLNRLDEVLVYSALERETLERIFDKYLTDLHVRALEQAGVPLLIKVSEGAKQFIIERGTDLRFGARPLRRAVERELVGPLSRLIASESLQAGDVVQVELDGDELAFYRTVAASGVVT